MGEDWELTTLLGGWGVGGREEFQKREAGLCLGIRPIYYSISLVKPSWEFWVCNLISRSAFFFVVLGKDDQDWACAPVISCARLEELWWEHSRHFSASPGAEAGPLPSKGALCAHVHQPVL